ncbi:MAG: nuclear transport factor 2 family protein [Candidatus Thermoplasmatota archaeon]|nr:nuclear transport factor 2 family protein [Candidatus Thermoplasmatota archaeon]
MTKKNELEEKLTNFFNAENDRDWKLYESFLSEDVEWISYGPPKRKVVSGKKDYIKTMIRAYRNIPERFSVLNMVSDIERGVVIAELELRSRRSVDIFEFENGLIKREREYYDDTLWLEPKNKP